MKGSIDVALAQGNGHPSKRELFNRKAALGLGSMGGSEEDDEMTYTDDWQTASDRWP